jgi:hypothetical protein
MWDDPEQDGEARFWNMPRREERAGKKLKRKECGKK